MRTLRFCVLHGSRKTLLLWLTILIWLAGALSPLPASAQGGTPVTPKKYLPILNYGSLRPEDRLCRLGVAGTSNIANYQVAPLRIGWYMDWQAWTRPAKPGGIAYAPTIRLAQSGSSYYIPFPNPNSIINATAQANPGLMWIIGNEPDRRAYQDDVTAEVYARAYHDIYHMLKNLDSTAQIVAGNIVEPTCLRLAYLDKVLQTYQTLYGEKMPVDIWSIHTYPLSENSTGADIPPGFPPDSPPPGCLPKIYSYADSANPAIFQQFVKDMRQWMKKNGYNNTPLILPEWGVLMSQSVVSAASVNAYMNSTMNWLLNATGSYVGDPTLGYPADNYHLVQRAAWFSMDIPTLGDGFMLNGWLFDPTTKARMVFGDNFAAGTAPIVPVVNLKAVDVTYNLPGAPGTVNLIARVVNNGNVSTSRGFVVRFYDGQPGAGGVQIGQDQPVSLLDGCTTPLVTAKTTWTGASPGTHVVFAVVDPTDQVPEDTADNTTSVSVTVP